MTLCCANAGMKAPHSRASNESRRAVPWLPFHGRRTAANGRGRTRNARCCFALAIFTGEMLCKGLAFGVSFYVQDGFCQLDLATVVLAWAVLVYRFEEEQLVALSWLEPGLSYLFAAAALTALTAMLAQHAPPGGAARGGKDERDL